MFLWAGLRALSSFSYSPQMPSIAAGCDSKSRKVREPALLLYCTRSRVWRSSCAAGGMQLLAVRAKTANTCHNLLANTSGASNETTKQLIHTDGSEGETPEFSLFFGQIASPFYGPCVRSQKTRICL